VSRLLDVFDRLVDRGHTILVAEHNLEVVWRADWVVDLGPEGGDQGGRVVACGTPAQVAAGGSWTGLALAGAGQNAEMLEPDE
jgi:excinuclease ABC subunit A